MRILIVEDMEVATQIKTSLENEGHEVDSIPCPIAAPDFKDENPEYDCLIVDLHMPPDGLTVEQLHDTRGAMLTGWVWLQNYVFPFRPELVNHTIIYSAYLNVLEEENPPGLDLILAKNRIRKLGVGSSIEKLLKRVQEFEQP